MPTDRLRMHVWTSGPADGRPLLLVHGNITTGGFWKYVAEALPGDVRVIARRVHGGAMTQVDPRHWALVSSISTLPVWYGTPLWL